MYSPIKFPASSSAPYGAYPVRRLPRTSVTTPLPSLPIPLPPAPPLPTPPTVTYPTSRTVIPPPLPPSPGTITPPTGQSPPRPATRRKDRLVTWYYIREWRS